MGLSAITTCLLAFDKQVRQHAPCRSRGAQEIVKSLGTTFLEFPYSLQRRLSRPESPWTLTDTCVVIEDSRANAIRFDLKASEVAKAPEAPCAVSRYLFRTCDT